MKGPLLSGEVFDAAAREFLRVFLRSLAAAVSQGSSAISVAWLWLEVEDQLERVSILLLLAPIHPKIKCKIANINATFIL